MENTQSKGMSKGCLIGLIVAAAILLLIIIGLVTCWVYKEDLAKMGATTLVTGLKTELANNQFEDVDTVQFNVIADAFLEKLEQEEQLDLQTYGIFMQSLQGVMADKIFDAEEVPAVVNAFVLYYPELEELRPIFEEAEPPAEEDSLSTE